MSLPRLLIVTVALLSLPVSALADDAANKATSETAKSDETSKSDEPPKEEATEKAETTPVKKAAVSPIPKNEFFPAFKAADALKEEKFSDEEMKEMLEGEIIVKSRDVPAGREGIHVVAAGILNGTTEEVFSIVMDCDGQPDYTPHLEVCKNTYPEGVNPATAENYVQYQKLEFGFGFISKEIEYTNNMYAIRPYVSAWVLKEKGDVDESIGYWRVIPLEKEKQLLVYDVYNKPSMSVPNWVQEILTKSDLPNTIEAFRERLAEMRGK